MEGQVYKAKKRLGDLEREDGTQESVGAQLGFSAPEMARFRKVFNGADKDGSNFLQTEVRLQFRKVLFIKSAWNCSPVFHRVSHRPR